MFTGIIEGMGTLTSIQPSGEGKRITIQSDFDLGNTRLGDSIAVNGVCLTATDLGNRYFSADVSPETLARSTFRTAKVGDRMNLERALRLSDRLGGHLVSGHIDGVGSLRKKTRKGNAWILSISVPETLSRYIIEKGSIAVDGVSLTINQCSATQVEVSIIPHTAGMTTVGIKHPGDPVNIETDMIGKYVEKLIAPYTHDPSARPQSLDISVLARAGFLS
jgi:riboflavin synthase